MKFTLVDYGVYSAYYITPQGKHILDSCKAITGLRLDEESREVLKRLKRKRSLSNALAATVATGVVSNIFTKNTVPFVAINISQTDWSLFFTAMQSIPKIKAKAINNDIDLMILHYEMPYNAKHLAFWKGLKHACK